MTSFKAICYFCFRDICNEDFELIQDTTKYMLDFLSIPLNLDESSSHTICNVCSSNLLAAFEFKSTCKHTDTTIIAYVDCKNPFQLDLRDIYLKEKEDKNTVMLSVDEKICRLCMELTGPNFVPLQAIEMDELRKFLPEINMSIIRDPVMCKSCSDSFVTHSNFVKNCLDIQESIKNSRYSEYAGQTETSVLNNCIKMDNMDIKIEEKFSPVSHIEPENIKTVIEENEPTYIKKEDIKTELPDNLNSEKSEYVCPLLPNEPEAKKYQCDECNYSSNNKYSLIYHQIRHKDSSQVRVYECNMCDYKSKFKGTLKVHLLVHKDPSEVKMYKCDVCDYESKYKGKLKTHALRHKDPSQLRMFECELCDYKTKFKSSLPVHMLRHKDPSQVPMHKCDICGYETKYKGKLKSHQLKHKDPSELQVYKCETCSYKTTVKAYLKTHKLIHRDPSQVPRYKCDACDYETKNKHYLKTHKLVHRSAPQIEVCDMCNPSMFKCYNCDFESTLEELKIHVLTHKNWS